MEELLEALKSQHHAELEAAQSRLKECHTREVGQLTTSLEQQVSLLHANLVCENSSSA